jgi:hypothetical protein
MPDAIDMIVHELEPYIGVHMSRSVVTGSLEQLGAAPGQVTQEQLETLVHRLGLGMNVFVGHRVSKRIVDSLRRRLGLGSKKPGA